jgi:hypothetical protein
MCHSSGFLSKHVLPQTRVKYLSQIEGSDIYTTGLKRCGPIWVQAVIEARYLRYCKFTDLNVHLLKMKIHCY